MQDNATGNLSSVLQERSESKNNSSFQNERKQDRKTFKNTIILQAIKKPSKMKPSHHVDHSKTSKETKENLLNFFQLLKRKKEDHKELKRILANYESFKDEKVSAGSD